MAWTPLRDRFAALPLVLAGPILRQTTPNSVTVWVALRAACRVTLTVYTTDGTGESVERQLFAGARRTVALGEYLHVVAVTAIAPHTVDPIPQLQADQVYAYDLEFSDTTDGTSHTLAEALGSTDFSVDSSREASVSVSYFKHGLPTFALPPTEIEHLKIVYGSCRKIHGYGRDTLPILDDLIGTSAHEAERRPHQLFFMGDQIYGDDVADPFLYLLQEAAAALFGWQEQIPIIPSAGKTHVYPEELRPGHRSAIADQQGGFTAGIRNKADYADSHLFCFGEYCMAYLFSWSPVLWGGVPEGRDVSLDHRQLKEWQKESIGLELFSKTLWKVRRALANVPTYMIFDDHDISDDWYLNQAWCLRVLGKPLGYRAVQNGLLAYTFFQGWGNTPEQFELGQIGEKLLYAAEQWCASKSMDMEASFTIARYLGLPKSDPATGLPTLRMDGDVWILDHDPDSLRWHYTVRSDRHEVIVLDTRTWRGFPADDQTIAPPMLLSPSAFQKQIQDSFWESDRLNAQGANIELTILVAPTNLVSLQAIDWVQHRQLHQGKVFDNDVGDAWNIHKAAFSRFLKTLFAQREQVVILSGDIHYGAMVRLNYWSRNESGQTTAHVLTQLTSSAFKNAEWKTRAVHTKLKHLVPEGDRELMGWNDQPEQIEIQTIQGFIRWIKRQIPGQKPTVQRFHLKTQRQVGVENAMQITRCPAVPDWNYRIEWLHRQPVQFFRRAAQWVLTAEPPRKQNWFKKILLWVWRNRWVQEGPEVVGEANIGMMQVEWSQHPDYRTVTQDLYWYAPWEAGALVFSRFQAQLPLPESAEALDKFPE